MVAVNFPLTRRPIAAAMVAGSTQAALYSAAAVSNSAGQTQVLRISSHTVYGVSNEKLETFRWTALKHFEPEP